MNDTVLVLFCFQVTLKRRSGKSQLFKPRISSFFLSHSSKKCQGVLFLRHIVPSGNSHGQAKYEESQT